jgi:hypothetical protein
VYWGIFSRSPTQKLFRCNEAGNVTSREHLCSEMMVSRGPRPTLTQGLDREVTTDGGFRVGEKLGRNWC